MKKLSEIPTFRAFRSTDYTLYLIGRAVSQFGTFMQQTAVIWVIYTITKSNFMVGVATFAEQFPNFLLSIFGGLAADRYSRYKVVNITQTASMVQALLLTVLIWTSYKVVGQNVVWNHHLIWEMLVLSVMLGIINAFDVPARQAMIHDVVLDEADLPSGISMSASTASLARMAGPALAGIVLEKFGASFCFLVNALSFLGVIIALAFMKQPKNSKPRISNKKPFTELAEGFIYIWRTPSVGLIILMVVFLGLVVMPYPTLLPGFAKVVFKGNAKTFGYIGSFIAAGSFIGTFFIASLKQSASLRKILIQFGIVLSMALIGFSLIKNFPVAMMFAVFIGFGGVAQFTTSNIIVQSESSPRLRGRVISILIMAMYSTVPLGSLIVGAVSQRVGVPVTLLCQGVLGLCAALVFYYLMIKKSKTTGMQYENKNFN